MWNFIFVDWRSFVCLVFILVLYILVIELYYVSWYYLFFKMKKDDEFIYEGNYIMFL